MTGNLVIEQIGDGCVVLRLARAPVNALTPVFLGEIAAALGELERDDAVRSVVLTGTGKVLSAGMDLKEAVTFDVAGLAAMVDGLNRCYAAAYEFSKPLIVAANGHAIAGGLFFVLAGDYRIIASKALLGLTEVRVGVDFPVVASEIACHELGANAARRIMLSGENVTAAQALEMGFADEVVDAQVVVERAIARAREFAAIPPQAYAAVKAQLRQQPIERYQQTLREAPDPRCNGWFTDETHAAAAALLRQASGGGG